MLWSMRLFALATLFLVATPSAFARCVGMVVEADKAHPDAEETCASAHIVVPDGKGTTYRVGPQQSLKTLGDVPWPNLKAGDTVYIHHRDEPYREKILISARGTPEQWIRVLGVPGPNGELPVISGDGAVTGKNIRFRWQKPDLVEWLGVIHVAVGPEVPDDPHSLPPAYVEIANLKVQDGFSDYRFQAANGTWLKYSGFAACIYARSVAHLVIRNNILTNCGQGFYNWTGDGSSPSWWAALQTDTVISGNHFHNNGNPGSYLEHQLYSESDRIVIEYNRFGPQRVGARGSQIKDRSAGTVIRYNTIEQSREGWDMDLVEPEEAWPAVAHKPYLRQSFVYGNIVVSKGVKYPNIVHWNEDHQAGRGRATFPDGRLFFYHNTFVIVAARDSPEPYTIFNATWGGYDCPEAALPGVIDARNNVIALFPSPRAWRRAPTRLGYCRTENIALGTNWISPVFSREGKVTGWSSAVTPADNDPGFRSLDDLRPREDAPTAVAGGALAPEVRQNTLGMDLTPAYRFIGANRLEPRPKVGPGSSLGAY